METKTADLVYWNFYLPDGEVISEYCYEDYAWTVHELNSQGKRFEVQKVVIEKQSFTPVNTDELLECPF